MLVALALVALTLALVTEARGRELPWSDARQLVLVASADWEANHGVLTAYERDGEAWRRVLGPAPVMLGQGGAAWGLGLHPPANERIKKEGDGRSPAGVFRIGPAFGYASTAATSLSYRAMTAADYCIDAPGSPYYNRIVDAHVVGQAAADSTEPMRRDLHANGDVRYKFGFIIRHNDAAAPHAGSCIFAHIWRASDEATAGCTAMDETAMRRLLAWLRTDAQPVFVLLPQAEYARRETEWRLPDL